MKHKFTPGPWIHTPFNLRYLSVHADSGDPHLTRGKICDIEQSESFLTARRTRDQIEANARLISAAPALLEALENCYEGHCRVMHTGKPCACKFWDEARAAIAKATAQ